MRTNTIKKTQPPLTHEGGKGQAISPLVELRRTVLTCMLFEDTFYETGGAIAERIAELCQAVPLDDIARLAIEARDSMKLRHVPLFLVVQMSRSLVTGKGALVANTLDRVIQRADELCEFVSMYVRYGGRDGNPKTTWKLSAGIKRGLAAAFTKFDAYQLAKYNSGGYAMKLRDVMFMVRPKPKDDEQAKTWKKLANNQLESPDTWEVALSGGADKRETFERLLNEGKLGGLACLRNLRNMTQSGVSEALIRDRLTKGIPQALPFRFVTAARIVPGLEDAIEQAMFLGMADDAPLEGLTGLLIDVSGSMDAALHEKTEATRIDAAAGLAILLRERCRTARVATFSDAVVQVPPRRGFALRDAIQGSQPHVGTYLTRAIEDLSRKWPDLDRLIVVTDEQSADGLCKGFAKRNYLVNVAPNKTGVSYRDGWNRIDGWSDQVLNFIPEYEKSEA